MVDALRAAKPDEVYNLAAMSFVAVSWIQPTLTAEFTGVGVTRMLEAVREACPEARFYQASSSEMFGKVRETPQNEIDAVLPALAVRRGEGLRPPHHGQLPRVLRPLRRLGDPLQPRVAAPRPGVRDAQDHLARGRDQAREARASCALGNLDAKRDWGYAKDYVEAMWLMLQHHEPDDFVIATGETNTVRRCVEIAFDEAGLEWEPPRADRRLRSSARPRSTCSWATRPRRSAQLGWEPQTSFEELIRLMVRADLERLA